MKKHKNVLLIQTAQNKLLIRKYCIALKSASTHGGISRGEMTSQLSDILGSLSLSRQRKI